MHAQACRTASGAGVCGSALLELAWFASVLHAASTTRVRKRKAAGLDASQRTKVVHCDGTNQTTIDQSLTYC